MMMQAKMAVVAAREQQGAGALASVLATYPQCVPELIEFNTALVATTSYEHEAPTPEVASIAARARTRALAAVFPARTTHKQGVRAASVHATATSSLRELRRSNRLALVTVAQRMGLGVDVLSDLESGLIRVATIPDRCIRALAEVLNSTAEQVAALLHMQATAMPSMPALQRSSEGASKAAPEQHARDFGAAVRYSPNMSPDEKARWLDE